MAATIDIAGVIDRQKFGPFHFTVVGLSFLLMLADGYDNISIAYIAPLLLKEWGIPKSALGPLFGAGLLGGLFGPPIFGWLADRFGRKTAVIWGALFFGVFTLAQVWADSLGTMMALRFVAGIGIGGVLPITVALNTEFAPRRIRATMTLLGFVGVALGGALGGVVASTFMVSHGWQVIFWTGGIAPMLVGALALAFFPESPKFLALRPDRRGELVALLARLEPGLAIAPDDRFVLGDEANRAEFSMRHLLVGRLALMTPLFWIANVVSLLVFFFVNQWTPVLLTAAGMPAERAAMSTTLIMLGGLVGALAVMRPIDRIGMLPVPLLFALAIPVVAALGMPGLPEPVMLALAFAAGVCLVGFQFGIIATESQIYPTRIRSWAVGSHFAFGRVGSVIGPLVAGAMLAREMPVQHLFYVAAALLAIGLVVTARLTPLYRLRLAEMPQDGPAQAMAPATRLARR
jgi:AAHS family 4-hydroxybenzoate transporter-like MFS transporter